MQPHASERNRQMQRFAHPGNAQLGSDACHGIEDRRQDVRVLMSIQMSRLNACIQDLAHLPAKLIINLHASQRDCRRQMRNAGRETFGADQHQMDADIQFRILARQRNGVLKGRSRGHQSCGREDALAMRVNDAFIDIAREPEVVGVGDEVFQNYAA